MADEAGERTEQATERQIEKFRSEGRVATSRELSGAVALLGGLLGFVLVLGWLAEALMSITRVSLARVERPELEMVHVPEMVSAVLVGVGPGVLALVAPAAVASLALGLVTTGFNLTTDPLELKFERLDPIGGFQKLFTMHAVEGLVKSLLAMVLLFWAAWSAVSPYLDGLPSAAALPVPAQALVLSDVARALLVRVVLAALAIGAADFGWQKYRLGREMMMTRQQVKEEHKQLEGDPQVRAARRRRARQLSAGQMLRAVARADVVITNPTHYAIALRYRKEENAAPVVLARGVDHLALQIRTLAARNDVAVVENRPLARAMYAKVRPGMPIPKDFFGPVAQVLAAVYRKRRKNQPTKKV